MTDWWIFANCDCLGCLMDAHRAGDITSEEYDDINAAQNQPLMPTAPCPRCQQTAYISLYEPDTMHCPGCGAYSFREYVTGDWAVAWEGEPIGERVRP